MRLGWLARAAFVFTGLLAGFLATDFHGSSRIKILLHFGMLPVFHRNYAPSTASAQSFALLSPLAAARF
jgi:hypothetical protein